MEIVQIQIVPWILGRLPVDLSFDIWTCIYQGLSSCPNIGFHQECLHWNSHS